MKSIFKYIKTSKDSIPLPVIMTEEDEKAGSVSKSSIRAGLLKALGSAASDNRARENFSYYKELLLKDEKPENLYQASLVRIQKNDFDNAEIILKGLCAIEKEEKYFITLATLYSKMAVVNEEDEKKAELYTTLALEVLKSAYELFKDSPDVLMELGAFHFKEGNYPEAGEYLQKFLSLTTDNDPRKENAKSLIQSAEAAIQMEEDGAEIYDLVIMDKCDEAIEKAKLYIEKYPKEGGFHLLYGWALRVKENFKEGRDELLKALKMGVNDAELYNELSLCEWEVGDKDLSISYMETAYDTDDENSTIFLSNLVMMYISTNNLEKASSALYTLIKRDKNDPMIETLISFFNEKSKEKFVPPEEYKSNTDSSEHHCSCGHHHEHGEHHHCTCGGHHSHTEEHHCSCSHHND